MSSKWPVVRLGDVVHQVRRAEPVDPVKEYRLLGIRLDGAGPFIREVKLGSESAATTLFRVQSGDFAYSRLFAWRGSFAVIEPLLDGCHVSAEFPTFQVDPRRLDIGYLNYWFRLRQTLERVQADCSGSTPLTRNRFKEQFFEGLQIPLPPLEEQRRIVANLDRVASAAREVGAICESASSDVRGLLVAIAHRRDFPESKKPALGWRLVPLGDLLAQESELVAVQPGCSYPNLGMYSFARGLFGKPPIDGLSSSATTLNRVRRGQFIYSRLFAFEGAYGMVDAEFDGFFVSNEYPTFRCNPTTVRPEFLVAYFKAPEVWRHVAAGSKGLGHRRQRVQPAQLLTHRLWLPPLGWQDRIAEVLRRSRAMAPAMEAHTTDLAALMPTILDRAFRGEL